MMPRVPKNSSDAVMPDLVREAPAPSRPGQNARSSCAMAEFFPYAVDARLAPFWLPFGVRPGRDGVTITDDSTFRATFGLFPSVETPLDNIDGAHVTREYRWWT